MAEKLIGILNNKTQLDGTIELDTITVHQTDRDVIQEYDSHLNFPNQGKLQTIYIDKQNNKSYRWDNDELKYYIIGSDYHDIKIINGGNANG